MRSDKGDQLNSPFITVPDRSGHTNSYAGGGSGSVFSGSLFQGGEIRDDGGLVQREPPRRNTFKKIVDSYRVQTDSNDARPSQNTEKKATTRQPSDITIERNIVQRPSVRESEHFTKAQTLYSGDQNILDMERTQLYILQFADYLYSRLQEQQPLTENSLDVITRLLPELLVAFALKLDQTSQSQIKRDAMYFVYRHRK